MQRFTHLHAHTDASLKDGLRPVAEMVKVAKNRGFDHLAMTDHGTLANAVAFSVECQTLGIKPILGVEGYIMFDSGPDTYGHITLLADGQEGFANIVRLQNIAHMSEFKKPAFTVDQLIAHNEGIICLSGCVSSPLQQLPLGDAIKLGAKLKSAFGYRLFSEVMFVADVDTYTRPITLAEKLGLKIVVTNDAHFPERGDAEVHPLLTSMKAGFTYNSSNLFLKTGDEIIASAIRFVGRDRVSEWLDRAWKIGNIIKPVNLKQDPKLPAIPNAYEKLEKMVLNNVKGFGPEYLERAQYELSVIRDMGFPTYFIVLEDIIKHARSIGVRVGPGRGSGAGSLVLYLLGVTEIDPLKFDLPFERFLNPHRKGMPDVDSDFDSERRGEVLDYAKKRWDAKPIATYSRYSHKSLVHALGKVVRMTRAEEEELSDSEYGSDYFNEMAAKYPMFAKAYAAILGQISHMGKHAGGVVISGDTIVPIERTAGSKGEYAISWTEGHHAELSYAGLVKYDLLGLSALSVLRRLETKYGRRADPCVDGAAPFEIFQKGDLAGIFQFSGSAGIHQLTMKLAPNKFVDLVAINALYRPGALDAGTAALYPEWKVTPRVVPPLFADILAPTYGAIVFQEQVMGLFARATGGGLAKADEARRTISKIKEADAAWMEKFLKLQTEFVEGCLVHGISKKDADQFWSEIATHSRYSFNKAHSVAYAQVAWEMAWWKYYYRADFYAESINITPDDTQTYLVAAVSDGIELLMPHVNTSGSEYSVVDGKIAIPLSAIKFLSPDAAAEIVRIRESSGPFKSGTDFMKRVPKKIVRGQARTGLFYIGAFDGIEKDVAELKVDPIVFDVGETTKAHMMRRFMGVVLPSRAALKKVEAAKKSGEVAGIVVEIVDKESTYGAYHVVKLMPTGVFWMRGLLAPGALKVGDLVAAKVREETGKAKSVRFL